MGQPCPECARLYGFRRMIGHQRGQCRQCNRFAQAVRRESARIALESLPPDMAAEVNEAARAVVYARTFPAGDPLDGVEILPPLYRAYER